MALNFKKVNQFNFTGGTVIVIVAVILIMLNWLCAKNFWRWDLTADKQYTISQTSKKILAGLDDIVTIKVFLSNKLPANLLTTSQYLKDILAEYQTYAQGKVRVEYLDPGNDTDKINQARSLGVPQIQMNVLAKDKFEVQNGFLGLAVLYGDASQALPVIEDTAGLEYDLTSAVSKLTAAITPQIAFTTGHGEHGLIANPYLQGTSSSQATPDYTVIYDALQQLYTVKPVDLITDNLKDIKLLVVGGPKTDLTEAELFSIDQFIMTGGQVIFLLDKVDIGDSLIASPINAAWTAFLRNYGVNVLDQLILDRSNEPTTFSSGYTQYVIQYPFWPKLIKDNFSASPLVSKINSLSFAWASPLELLPVAGVAAETIAATTKNAWTQSTPFDLDPTQTFDSTGGFKQYPMAGLLSGVFPSYFKGKDIPEAFSKANPDYQKVDQSANNARILAVGDSDFITDNMDQRFPGNAVFILNAIDYLASDYNLINIRSKDLTNRPIEELTETTKTALRLLGLFGASAAAVIYGLARFAWRRHQRNLGY